MPDPFFHHVRELPQCSLLKREQSPTDCLMFLQFFAFWTLPIYSINDSC